MPSFALPSGGRGPRSRAPATPLDPLALRRAAERRGLAARGESSARRMSPDTACPPALASDRGHPFHRSSSPPCRVGGAFPRCTVFLRAQSDPASISFLSTSRRAKGGVASLRSEHLAAGRAPPPVKREALFAPACAFFLAFIGGDPAAAVTANRKPSPLSGIVNHQPPTAVARYWRT
jgi:hypothetical protein